MRWTLIAGRRMVLRMKLYFSPLACSLATRIALYEANAEASFVEVDGKTKKTSNGIDFATVHPLGLVPALEIEDGVVLTENAAVLQYIGERFPDARLVPDDALGRVQLRQWLSFVATELHKAVFVPLLDKTASKDVKAYALAKADLRLRFVADRLAGRDYLLDRFSVADAYLFAVPNWTLATPVDLGPYPAIRAYHKRLRERPSVDRAFGEERVLYARELAGNAASAVWNAVVGR